MTGYLKAGLEQKTISALAQKAEIEARLAALEQELAAKSHQADQERNAHLSEIDALRVAGQTELVRLKGAADAELQGVMMELNRSRVALAGAIQESERREQTLRAVVDQKADEVRRQSDRHVRELLEREQAHGEQIEWLRAQASAREVRERELATQELMVAQRDISAARAALEAFRIDRDQRETALSAAFEHKLKEARLQVEGLKSELLQRERQNFVALMEQEQALRAREQKQKIESKAVLDTISHALDESRSQTERVRQESRELERELSLQLERAAAESRRRAVEHANELLEREQFHTQQLLARKNEAELREGELRAKLEQALAAAELAAKEHLNERREREARHSEALEALQKQFEAREAAFLEQHEQDLGALALDLNGARTQIGALLSEQMRREQEYAEQMQQVALDHEMATAATAARDHSHAEEVAALNLAAAAREEQNREVYEARLMELTSGWQSRERQLQSAHETREAELLAACDTVRKQIAQQAEAVRDLGADLALIRRHWTWKITRPFRRADIDKVLGQQRIQQIESAFCLAPAEMEPFIDRMLAAREGARRDETATRVHDMTLTELLSLPREDFIRAAYRRILGRAADAGGIRHYVERLSRGHSKQSVLYDLAMSREGRAYIGNGGQMALPPRTFISALFGRLLGLGPGPVGSRNNADRVQRGNDHSQIDPDVGSSGETGAHHIPEQQFRAELMSLLQNEKAARGFLAWPQRHRSLETRLAAIECAMEQVQSAKAALAPSNVSQLPVSADTILQLASGVATATQHENAATPSDTDLQTEGQFSHQRTPLERHFSAYSASK